MSLDCEEELTPMGGEARRLDKGWGKQGGDGKDDAVSVLGRGATATHPLLQDTCACW